MYGCHVSTAKNDQRIIVVHVWDSHVEAFERGPNFYYRKLRVHDKLRVH